MERHRKLWEEGKPQEKEITVGWLADEQKLKFLREKEGSDDYRYFPEPDVPPLTVDKKVVRNLRENLPELPSAMRERLTSSYELSIDQVDMLLSDLRLLTFFEEVAKKNGARETFRWAVSEWGEVQKRIELPIYQSPVTPSKLSKMMDMIASGTISGKIAKEVLLDMAHTEKTAEEIVAEKGLGQMSDTAELETICKQVVEENPQTVADFRNGKDRAFGSLVGQVMARTKGQANPKLVNEILRRLTA